MTWTVSGAYLLAWDVDSPVIVQYPKPDGKMISSRRASGQLSTVTDKAHKTEIVTYLMRLTHP